MAAPLLEMRDITKKFPGVTALTDVSIHANAGEILAIVGENDSKTTLAQSLRLVEAAKEPKELWIVPAAAHEDFHAHSPDEYERRLLAFFARHLDP